MVLNYFLFCMRIVLKCIKKNGSCGNCMEQGLLASQLLCVIITQMTYFLYKLLCVYKIVSLVFFRGLC